MSYEQKHQQSRPDPVSRDSRGKGIKPRAYVAYNKSGSVKLGYICDILRNEWKIARNGVGNNKWWYLKYEATVINADTEEITTVRNPNSLIIL